MPSLAESSYSVRVWLRWEQGLFILLGSHGVDGVEYGWFADDPALQPVFAGIVHDHQSEEDGEDSLSGGEEHDESGNQKDGTEYVFKPCQK